MPREIVTKGSRFYCVSATPDICKTPIGASTPPIPYMIKGEFSEATGVSKNIRSNGELVVISDSTVIPKVTGDEAGTAKGIKSGTVGKRVQHDQKISTVSFNGERAIREGDTVFMNDGNTRGKVLQRGGGAPGVASPVSKHGATKSVTPKNALDAAQAWTKKIGQSVENATRIAPVREMKDRLQNGVRILGDMTRPLLDLIGTSVFVDFQEDITNGLIEFIPDNLLDLVPAKKIGQAGKLIKKSAGALAKIGQAGKAGNKSVPPIKGTDGGKSLGKGKKEKKDKPSNCCPKNAGPGGKRTSSKHPVHFGTGEEVLQQTDFALGGAIPIVWTRCYRSASEAQDWSMLGARWASPFSSHLSMSRKGIVYHDDSGRTLRLPNINLGAEFDHRGEGFVLSRPDEGRFTLTWRDGSRDHYMRAGTGWLPHGYDGVNAMLPPEQAELCDRFTLCRSEDASGRGLDVERFDLPSEPVLMRIVTDDGRVVEAMRKRRTKHVETDLVSQVDEVRSDGTRICHVTYEYLADRTDATYEMARRYDLVSQTDRSGATRRYRYAMHLLTGYTTYGGFEHRLEWISLAALRERWQGSALTDAALIELHPITIDNSYQARAIATRTADGRDEVTIQYLDEDTTRVTEPSGAVFDYTFDENWLAVDIALVPAGGGHSKSLGQRMWDADGMLIEETDALFRTWRYRYDDAGNLVANTDAESNTTLLAYDAQNRPIRITDALGNGTVYAYDASGNLASVTNALGHTTHLEYDAQGRVSAQVDARGGRTQYTYDASGRLRSHTDCSGYRSHYRYDADDNLIAVIDALEQETGYRYDTPGQVTTITQPDGTQEHYAYDADGNVLTHTDALGYQTHFRYNGHGMPVEQINALGHSVKYRYDAALRLVELINGNGESYRFAYTPEGWLASETSYDGKVTTYRYDRAGQLIAYESCDVEIMLERDRMGRLLLKTTPDGCTRYQYDALGRLAAVTAPHAENGFVYDAIGQLLEEHSAYFISEPCPQAYKLRRVPDRYFVMRYAYDELGNRIQTILPDGHRIDVLRYGSGHWHGVLWDGEPVVDVERDRLHRERRRQIGPKSMNLVATRSYDAMSRIATMVLTKESKDSVVLPFQNRNFEYDAVGNLVSVRHGRMREDIAPRDHKYKYDGLSRITEASCQEFDEKFSFDPHGNLLSTLFHKPYNFSQEGIVASIKHSDFRKWNRNRNLEQKAVAPLNKNASLELLHNSENLLTEAKTSLSDKRLATTYYYDCFSRRIAKKIREISRDPPRRLKPSSNSHITTTIFTWDGETLSQSIESERIITHIFEPEKFTPLALLLATGYNDSNQKSEQVEIFSYSCDHIGTALELTNRNGNSVWKNSTSTWGRKTASEWTVQKLRFPGQYEDDETGLHYNRYRYYDPDNGRYISSDPLGLLGGINTYQYAPNPIDWLDPLGLSKCNKNNGCNPCDGHNPSSAARAWQGPGNAPYLGQDTYENVVVKKGTVLYTLYPHGGAPGNYFSNSNTLLAGATARGFNDALQTAHQGNWKDKRARPMRTQVHAYILEKDLCMAKGLAKNNPNLGKGGGTQFFIENSDKRHLFDTTRIMRLSK